MKKFILIAFAAAAALVSCTKELDSPEPGILGTVTFKASIVETRTHLGDKEGTSWPNYWSEGDYISVNGVNSTPLDASFDGSATAQFTVEDVAAPYYAVYPGYLVSDYADGAATLNLPAEQSYVDGSYDPDAYIMVGKTSNASLALVPQVAIFSITPTGTGTKIKSVSLTSLGGKKIAGAFTTDFESITAASNAKSTVTVSAEEGIDLGEPWRIVIPAADFTAEGIKIVVADEDGGVMTRTTKPSKAYVAGKMYSASIPYAADPLSLTAAETSSSSLTFEWGYGSPEADAALAYTVALYSDQACSNLVVSFDIPANYGCWFDDEHLNEGNRIEPKFVFGGLAPSTTYYCKVTNTTKGETSDVVASTTDDFTCVDAQAVSNASEGDVILAEDFGEIAWSPDELAKAAGYVPDMKKLETPSGALSTEEGSYVTVKNTGNRLFSSGLDLISGKRLSTGWGFFGNSSVYIRSGYLRISTKSGRTHLVTPALSGIPSGKYATIDVTVTAANYGETSNDVAVFAESGLTLNTTIDPSSASFRKYTGASLSDGHALGLESSREWETKTVTINNVQATDQLLVGSLKDVSEQNRFFLSDIKVEIVSLYDEPMIEAECIYSSSSTLTFAWSATGNSAEDILKPYVISLSRDEEGSDEVVSYLIEPGVDAETGDPVAAPCWKDNDGKANSTRFVFGGLDPGTTYYFHVVEIESDMSSGFVPATTSEFTVVDPSTVSDAGVGDVILAEDFSEIGWGTDEFYKAGGSFPKSPKELFAPSGELSSEEVSFAAYNSTSRRLYGDTKVTSDKRLFDWGFFGNSAVYAFSGYVRVTTTSSGSRTHIVSPALAGIPDGKYATIDVTVTSLLNDNSSNDVAVFVNDYTSLTRVLDPDQKDDSNFSGSGGKFTGVSLSDGYPLEAAYRSWTTKTVRIERVTNTDCLVIGSYQNVDAKNRFCLSDVKVEIVELKTPGQVDEEMDVYDFNTLKTFLTKSASGIVMGANVTADIALTSAEEAEIADLYPIVDFTGRVNGGNHTIAGLTKPLFDILEGFVSDLTLESTLNISVAQNNIGIFANTAINATLTGCVSTGSVTSSASEVSGDLALGGLVGRISGCTFTACQNQAAVTNTTAASGTACVGGLIGVADGANNLSGTASAYNYNQGVIVEQSATEDVAVGGVCGYTFNVASNFNYCKSLAPDGADVEDIEIKNSTKNKVYVGGIIGKSAVTSSMDYTYNSSDIKFTSLKITQTGQVFGGGIIGGWTASGEQTITGCTNSGWVYTKGSAGDLAAADSDALPKYWSCFAGIAGMGAGTSESLGSSWYTITGKTFTNCTNTGTVRIYAALRSCIAGVVAYTENNPNGCVCTATDIRPYLAGGIKQVGDNYHRNICGGVVGLCTASKVSNLKSTAKIVSQSSSPFAYTGGIIGYVPAGTIELENCKVSNHVQAAGSGDGRSALMCHVAQNAVNVTFTNCVVKSGTLSYSTGSKVTISSSNLTAQHCVGSGSKYTIVDDVLPAVAASID